eukprot:2870629-Rhodomonas_salina.2
MEGHNVGQIMAAPLRSFPGAEHYRSCSLCAQGAAIANEQLRMLLSIALCIAAAISIRLQNSGVSNKVG